MNDSPFSEFLPYLTATAIGLGLGFERDWSKRNDVQQPAGARTFGALALGGAIAAGLGEVILSVTTVAIAAIISLGYWRTSAVDKGATTEIASLVTFLLGALAFKDERLAVALAVVLGVLLLAREPLHQLARQEVNETEIADALRFFVVAFVVLPLLPNRAMGPYGVLNPFKIWAIVVALTGIGWLGYVAVRVLGARKGLLVTGVAGGFVSATATTGSMGRLAKTNPEQHTAALSGAIVASCATLIQLGLIVAIANTELLYNLLPALCFGLAVIAVESFILFRRARRHSHVAEQSASDDESESSDIKRRPFALSPALILAAILTAVLVIARWGSDVFGSSGLIATVAMAGFADAHASVLGVAGLAAQGNATLHTAMIASGAALGTNTISKCVVAFVAGGKRFGAEFFALILVPSVVVAVVFVFTTVS